MVYTFHKASYNLGDRELNPEERVVISTRPGPEEARRVAQHLGISKEQPGLIIVHKEWSDEEYLPTFQTKQSLENPKFNRYVKNYQQENKKINWGQGLKGRTVYIVHTFSNRLTPQDLDTRVSHIAQTAKYNGAEAVVLLAYTLFHSAQERGVHQYEHPRMQSEEAKKKFDGQAPLSQVQLLNYAMSGIDTIITPHNHCPEDNQILCQEVNEYLGPLRKAYPNSTLRHKINFFNIDLSPMLGYFISDSGPSNLEFDLSNRGENVLFLSPDAGAAGFAKSVRKNSGLENSALAIMNKKRAEDGEKIDLLELVDSINLNPERGIEKYHVIVTDDAIRSGRTMQQNINVLRGNKIKGIIRDPRIKGTPSRVVAYATRTNFPGNSVKILSSSALDDIIITNSDPRAINHLGELDQKTQMIYINFMMGEAAKAIERGEDPNEIFTPKYIKRNRLLKVFMPHGHKLNQTTNSGII